MPAATGEATTRATLPSTNGCKTSRKVGTKNRFDGRSPSRMGIELTMILKANLRLLAVLTALLSTTACAQQPPPAANEAPPRAEDRESRPDVPPFDDHNDRFRPPLARGPEGRGPEDGPRNPPGGFDRRP